MEKSGKKRRGRRASQSVIALAMTFAATFVQAQSTFENGAVQQARLFNERPTSGVSATGEQLFPPIESFSGDSAADSDVGQQWLLKRNLPPNPFTVRASFSILYTSNVALSRFSPLGDAFAVADFGIGYVRPITQDWTLGINVQQSFFRYDQYSEFDFESTNVNVALSRQIPQLGNFSFSIQYALSRLTGGSLDEQLYFGHTFALGVAKVIQVNPANSVEFDGAAGYTLADPSDLQRGEVRSAVTYSVQFARNFSATAVARLEFYGYTNDDRQDLLQSVALGARWDLTNWLFLSGSISLANNLSSQPAFSYRALNTGATVTAHIRF
ncbi:MAG: hypothetical protein ABR526_08520 [Chthoniobacterales bacterium]